MPSVSNNPKLPPAAEQAQPALSAKPWKEKEKPLGPDPVEMLKLFIVPIVAVSIFVGLLLFLIIPGVLDIFAKFEDLDSVRQNTNTINETITQLQELSDNRDQLTQDLELVNKIAPVGATEVVVFQKKVAALAATNGLAVVRTLTDEQILAIENDNPVLGINEIPSRLSVNGTLQNIKKFITEINNLEDFVIIGEMQIRVVDSVVVERLTDPSLNWNLEITLIKYQFQQPNAQNQLAEAYAAVPVTVKIEKSILDFIRNKFSNEGSGFDLELFQE